MERSIGKLWANKIVYLVVLLVPLIAGLVLIYAVKLRKSQPRTRFLQNITISRVTNEGNVETAAISPDGTHVAYTLEENGKRSLWTKHIETGNRVQLVSPQESPAMTVSTFSSANNVYYSVSDQSNPQGALLQISAQGGSPKKLVSGVSTPVALSHDGRYLAFVRRLVKTDELFVADSDGSNERLLLRVDQPNWLGNSSPTWSPDDSILAIGFGSEDRNESTGRNLGMTPILISVTDGKMKPLAHSRWMEIGRISWLNDGSGLLFVAQRLALSPRQLWQIAYPRGESRPVTNDLNSYDINSLTQTRDGSRVLAVQSSDVSNIWIATVGQSGSEKAVTTLKADSEGSRGLTWTVDGRIVFDANVNGRAGLWSINAEGGEPSALINNETEDIAPESSKDGQRLIFGSYRAGHMQVWQAALDGTNQRKLTSEPGGVANFSVSRDGRWVVYAPLSGGIRRVSIEGGQATELIAEGSIGYAQISPDGKLVAYFLNDAQSLKPKIGIINFDTGGLVKTIDLPSNSQPNAHDYLFHRGWHWSPNGQDIVYINTVNGVSNLWSQPIDSGVAKQITDFESERILTFAFSPDGRRIALARTRSASNAVLITSRK